MSCGYLAQYFDNIVADLIHQRSDSGPEVDTVGIYVKIIVVDVENSSFGCDFIFEKWISEVSGIATEGPSDFQIMFPGGDCFAPGATRDDI